MSRRTIILYHDNCLDGFVAAMLAHTKAIYDGRPNLRMYPVNYNQPPIFACPGDDLIIVDFSYDPAVIEDYRNRGVNVTIVDHHETQIDKLNDAKFGKHTSSFAEGVKFSCDCRPGGNFFSKLIPESRVMGGEYRSYLADNRGVNKRDKECGASLVYEICKRVDGFQEFMTKFMTYYRPDGKNANELRHLLILTRIHDLWLHDGDIEHPATHLATWFKEFSGMHREARQDMKKYPFISAETFSKMKAAFQVVPLEEKLIIGKKLIDIMMIEINKRCSLALTVKAPAVPSSHGMKIGLIPGEFKNMNISTCGSTLVKKYGFDVAVMIVDINEQAITYSLRSDQNGNNYNLAEFTGELVRLGLATKGGGHRNAAGLTVPKKNLESVFL